MRLKLDENIDTRLSVLLRQAGHEATTVRDQGLHGTVDPEVYDHCISGAYVFVTLDLDFSNVLRYPPDPLQAWLFLGGRSTSSPSSRWFFRREFILAQPHPLP